MAAKFKKGDKVIVRAGKDAGNRGEILSVNPETNRAVVSGINRVKKHNRPTPMSPGGIETKEAPIQMSNLAHVDPKTDGPTRVGFKVLEDGRKVRFAKASGEVID